MIWLLASAAKGGSECSGFPQDISSCWEQEGSTDVLPGGAAPWGPSASHPGPSWLQVHFQLNQDQNGFSSPRNLVGRKGALGSRPHSGALNFAQSIGELRQESSTATSRPNWRGGRRGGLQSRCEKLEGSVASVGSDFNSGAEVVQ